MNLATKLILTGSIVLNVAFVVYTLRNRSLQKSAALTNLAFMDNWTEGRQSSFDVLPTSDSDIVFIGDSQTSGFALNEFFPGLPVKNRGIAGNESKHILSRLEATVKHKPAMVFLQMGINDIIAGVSADTLMANFEKAVSICYKYSASITIQSLFPTSGQYEKYNGQIRLFNDRLSIFCRRKFIPFIDIYPSLELNGGLNDSLTFDGLHLNGKGYEVWKGKIDSIYLVDQRKFE